MCNVHLKYAATKSHDVKRVIFASVWNKRCSSDWSGNHNLCYMIRRTSIKFKNACTQVHVIILILPKCLKKDHTKN